MTIMRVTQSLRQIEFLSSLTALESKLAQTQNQISTGLAYSTPSDNPYAAGAVDGFNQVLSQSQQYSTNATSAQSGLNTEDATLTQIQDQLRTLRGLALQANSGSVSPQNLQALATQATQIQSTLVTLANTQNGNGEYIFAGSASQTVPFALTAAGASYSGDQTPRQVQIAAGQTLSTGDNGDAVFNQIKTGNGTFVVAANAANTGSGLIGATTVVNGALYNGGSYTLQFASPTTYQVLDAANNVVSAGAYVSGQAIAFNGLSVNLSGAPATGDRFAVTPSVNQSVFTTVQNLVSALNSGASSTAARANLGNAIAGAINNLDQALNQTASIQASVGARLNTITTQLSVASTQQAQLTQSISDLQSLDYPSALSSLSLQNTTLSASMQAYTLTQGLSLFKYL